MFRLAIRYHTNEPAMNTEHNEDYSFVKGVAEKQARARSAGSALHVWIVRPGQPDLRG